MTAKRKPKSWEFWCGVENGKPGLDEYDRVKIRYVSLFKKKSDAQLCWDRVRKVRLILEEK